MTIKTDCYCAKTAIGLVNCVFVTVHGILGKGGGMFVIVYNITHVHASLLAYHEQASDYVQRDPWYLVNPLALFPGHYSSRSGLVNTVNL